MTIFELVATFVAFWLLWEAASVFVSKPLHPETREPLRPPLSLFEYLTYQAPTDGDE